MGEFYEKKLLIVYFCLMMGLLMIACSEIDRKVPKSEDGTEVTEMPVEATEPRVFEGRYFDESVYQYIDIPESESPLIYCEIMVSNVTDTSFDFTIHEKVMANGESKVIIAASTAVFIEDGTKAVYYGEEQTLYFMFDDEPELYPKHIQVQGFDKIDGKTYINNTIPGHESG